MRAVVGKAGLVAGLAVVACLSAGSAEQPGPKLPVSVERLIVQLGHTNFRVREAAGKELEARGDEALPALRKSLAHADPEVRRRVEVLTLKIERQVLLNPKRVTLKVKDRSVQEAADELGKQSGYRVMFQGGNPNLRVTIDLDNVPFWVAMDRLCNDAGLVCNMDDQQGALFLYQQDSYSPYVAHVGPFRITAQSFYFNKTLQLANLPRSNANQNVRNENLSFAFSVQSEPKAAMLGVGQPKVIKAEDERGASMVFPVPQQEGGFRRVYYNGGHRMFNTQSQVLLQRPGRDSARVKVLRIRLPVTLLAEQRPEITVEKLADAKKKKFNGANVELEVKDVVGQNNQYQITLAVRRNATGPEQDPNWVNTIASRLELTDAKGVKFMSQGISNFINQAPNAVEAVFLFVPPANVTVGEATRLVFNRWVSFEHEIELEFKNLPLP